MPATASAWGHSDRRAHKGCDQTTQRCVCEPLLQEFKPLEWEQFQPLPATDKGGNALSVTIRGWRGSLKKKAYLRYYRAVTSRQPTAPRRWRTSTYCSRITWRERRCEGEHCWAHRDPRPAEGLIQQLRRILRLFFPEQLSCWALCCALYPIPASKQLFIRGLWTGLLIPLNPMAAPPEPVCPGILPCSPDIFDKSYAPLKQAGLWNPEGYDTFEALTALFSVIYSSTMSSAGT